MLDYLGYIVCYTRTLKVVILVGEVVHRPAGEVSIPVQEEMEEGSLLSLGSSSMDGILQLLR